MDATEIARELAARRTRTRKACVVCGTPIEGIRIRRYCSNRCAAQASRAARKAGTPLRRPPAPAPVPGQEHDG